VVEAKWVEVPGKKGLYRYSGDLVVKKEAVQAARRTLCTSTSASIKNHCSDLDSTTVVLGRSTTSTKSVENNKHVS